MGWVYFDKCMLMGVWIVQLCHQCSSCGGGWDGQWNSCCCMLGYREAATHTRGKPRSRERAHNKKELHIGRFLNTTALVWVHGIVYLYQKCNIMLFNWFRVCFFFNFILLTTCLKSLRWLALQWSRRSRSSRPSSWQYGQLYVLKMFLGEKQWMQEMNNYFAVLKKEKENWEQEFNTEKKQTTKENSDSLTCWWMSHISDWISSGRRVFQDDPTTSMHRTSGF